MIITQQDAHRVRVSLKRGRKSTNDLSIYALAHQSDVLASGLVVGLDSDDAQVRAAFERVEALLDSDDADVAAAAAQAHVELRKAVVDEYRTRIARTQQALQTATLQRISARVSYDSTRRGARPWVRFSVRSRTHTATTDIDAILAALPEIEEEGVEDHA